MTANLQPREELANTITHALGICLGAVATTVLITKAAAQGDPRRILSFAVFGATVILLYTASTLYHAEREPARKTKLKRFDHISIYYLIAGTYTPVTLVGLGGKWGWALFGVVWTLALAGTMFKVLFTGRYPIVSTILYIAMGWTAAVAVVPLVNALPVSALLWLLAGGLSYTGGIIFYASKRLPFNHAIWHLFVLGGTICHFVVVVRL